MTAPSDPGTRPSEIIRSVAAGGSAKDKRVYWNEMVAQAIEPCDFRTADWEGFSASMRARPLGTGALTLIQSAPWQTSTTTGMLSVRRSGRIAIHVCLAGELTFDHEGKSTTLVPGQAAVVDSLRAHRLRGDKPVKLLCLSLDRGDLGGALKAVEGPAVVLSSEDPVAAVTIDLIRRTWRSLPEIDMVRRPQLQPRLGGLVAESLMRHAPEAEPASSHVLSMIFRAKLIVMRKAAEPGFGAVELAEAMGVTRRYLTTLFQNIGDTPADYIRRMRMHAAWDMLTDARSRLPVATVGERVGFPDGSQFAKAFKSIHGQTPLQVRRLGLT